MKMQTVRILKDLIDVVVILDIKEMVSTALETFQLVPTAVKMQTVFATALVMMDFTVMVTTALTSTNVQRI
jgi:hypothetical protein